jgi:hypothetical protein
MQLFIEITALPPNATSIKFFGFKRPMNSGSHFGSISQVPDRLCGLVVRVLGYRSRGLGSIPDTTRKKK